MVYFQISRVLLMGVSQRDLPLDLEPIRRETRKGDASELIKALTENWRRGSESDQFDLDYTYKMPEIIEEFNEIRVTGPNYF